MKIFVSNLINCRMLKEIPHIEITIWETVSMKSVTTIIKTILNSERNFILLQKSEINVSTEIIKKYFLTASIMVMVK